MYKLEIYQKLAYEVLMCRCECIKINRKVSLEDDVRALKGAVGKYPLRMAQLGVSSTEALPEEKLHKAKANYIQYRRVKVNKPEIVTKGVDRIMDNLAHIIAKWEGLLLYEYANGFSDFHAEKFRDYMLNQSKAMLMDKQFLYTIAEKYLAERSFEKKNNARFGECVTIFIDETIKNNPLSTNGGVISNYSYLIALGDLKKESQINSVNLIYEKVGEAHTTTHGEEITAEAIGNALFTLLYEYNYTNDVKIFIDNMTVRGHWKKRKKNFVVNKCFRSVSVNYVNRKHNTKADALSRQNVALTLTRKDFDKLDRIKQIPFPAAAFNPQNDKFNDGHNWFSNFRSPFKKRLAT
ncbi:hypothetical protein SAMN02745725_00352 [Pseudobutyrivibrio xylanivorans DSM 14809]|uniref:Uncharacterized protein n=2 Tax=Pseudobutyrivibrio xylanivorans TaxID=185007 RepID=A0A1M6B6Q8_PSEXY|nr:hypothetical protein SAMN02745725_00352 [Pseudobutyrivibrio xylanivorans DSM 14809]